MFFFVFQKSLHFLPAIVNVLFVSCFISIENCVLFMLFVVQYSLEDPSGEKSLLY